MWATVRTSNGDIQHDHLLEDVRERKFEDHLGKVVRARAFRKKPPLMLSWSAFATSTATIDVEVVASNMDYYLRWLGSSERYVLHLHGHASGTSYFR